MTTQIDFLVEAKNKPHARRIIKDNPDIPSFKEEEPKVGFVKEYRISIDPESIEVVEVEEE